MDPWNLAAAQAAATRERNAALRELFARIAGWLRATPAERLDTCHSSASR
jgi:hypothetical protein